MYSPGTLWKGAESAGNTLSGRPDLNGYPSCASQSIPVIIFGRVSCPFSYTTRQLFLRIFFKTMELNLVSDPSKNFSAFIFWLYYYESVIYFLFITRVRRYLNIYHRKLSCWKNLSYLAIWSRWSNLNVISMKFFNVPRKDTRCIYKRFLRAFEYSVINRMLSNVNYTD